MKTEMMDVVEFEGNQESAQLVLNPTPLSTISPPRKRTKCPGVRVVGGRIYDSENGKTCHQCRQKTMDFVTKCKNQRNDKPCTLGFCHKCLLNRYGEKAEEMAQLADWKCPKCRGICNCSFCMKKRGHQPTGILVHTAKATGFPSVSHMLIIKGPENISASPKKICASSKDSGIASPNKRGKENSTDGKDDKIRRYKRKKLVERNTDENMVYGEESKMTNEWDGSGQTKREISTPRLKKLARRIGYDNMREGTTDDVVQSNMNTEKSHISSEISSNSTEKEEEKINERDDGDQKPMESRICKKLTLDPIKALEETTDSKESQICISEEESPELIKKEEETDEMHNADNFGDNPKLITGLNKHKKNGKYICKAEFEADIPLPQGINLTNVAGIDLLPEDVGHALQFIHFCKAFGQILDLREGEPESILQELTGGGSLRPRQYSSLVQFHIQLLSLIQKDMGEESPSSPTSSGSSWLQALGKSVSKSQCSLKDLSMECFDHSGDGYEKLDSSKKLRLLNFLCDEALCTTVLRGWIDKQNEIFVKSGKEAKEKVLVAKDKGRRLKLEMQDEVAKAILLRNGAPLSISEHEDLISRIKFEAAKAHAEKLDAIGMVPKKKQSSDAVRTEPVILNGSGHIFWRLEGYSAEPSIMLQDIGRWDSDEPEDKWFTYDVEQKGAVENYISYLRRKRLRLQELPNGCTQTMEPTMKEESSDHPSPNLSD